MSQSKIFLTHINLNLEKLIPSLALQILDQLNNSSILNLNSLNQNYNSKIWEEYLNQGQIIIPQWISNLLKITGNDYSNQ